VCAVALVPHDALPPSDEALAEDGIARQPEWERLPATYLRRGRGALALLAVLGLAAFFLPWVDETMPEIASHSGFDLASHRVGWVFGAAVGWFVLLPTVLSRRSVMHMRGARVAASFLAAVPGVTALDLVLFPPHGNHGVPHRFTFEYGLYATLFCSVVAVGFGLFFGGRLDDLALRRGTSAGQVVH
jgi:hypothetical protein